MSEPRANPPQGEEAPPLPDGPRADAAPAPPGATPQPTDDTPTVISKSPPEPLPGEDGFAGGLRGRRLAHYELIEPIGVGGMAAVLRARDTQLDREVALKILPPETAADPENVRRFHQEARSAAKLDHETIARVFFCGEDQGLHFIAFEFVDGENLRTILEKRGRLPAAEAVTYVLQVAGGLAHAAGRGVVHRDIKPSNIIVSPGGRAKLVDMGLARSLEPTHDDGLTQSGVTLGTFDYISPEQALEPREADARSDIYSLGCTFYHALTGEPPVPEGTAARKLHHHHHVKPPDPRQFVPDLPDSVVTVLGRMMAKRPADRYQTPGHLVQDLQAVARELGANTESAEGVQTPEVAPLRPPPTGALVLAGLAVLAVIALAFLADPGGPAVSTGLFAARGGVADGGKQSTEAVERDRDKPPKQKAAAPVPAPTPVLPVRAVYDGPPRSDPLAEGEALAKWVADAKEKGATDLEVRLPGDVTLVADDPNHPCPLLQGSKVHVRAKVPGQRPTVKIIHHSPANQQQPWAALTVEGPDVTVEGIRFVVDASGGNYEMVGLRLVGPGRHRVKDCEFVQANPSFDPVKRLASLRAEASAGGASLRLEECCFLGYMAVDEVRVRMDQPASLQPFRVERGGQDAVVRRGPVRLEAVNCAFGPHAAAFRFEEAPAAAEDGRADVRHCSVLAGAESAAFDLAEMAAADLRVDACLFSRPADGASATTSGGRAAVLLRQSAPAGTPVVFHGKDNRYHNLDGYWLTADGRLLTEPSEFAHKLRDTGGSDDGARVLDVNPWRAAQPLKLLEQPLTARPGQAFRPDTQLPDLRIAVPGSRDSVAGVERLARDDFTAGLPLFAVRKYPPAVARQRVVDPSAVEDPARRVYNRLERAVDSAEPGDVILIRHQRQLPVSPLRLDKRNANLTIRAAPGCRPELTPSDTGDATALFQVGDGRLRLEDLDFRLQPGDDNRPLALVALEGAGECTVKGCSVTLEPAASGERESAAVATLTDAMTAGEARPQLNLEGCFIRGEGDVVRDRAGRPFDLKARNTLAVLAGSFLRVDAGDAVPAGQAIRATLGKVTTYLTGHLVRLQAGKEQRGPVPVQCVAKGCLFVAAASRSLVHLDGPETSEDRLKERLDWTGDGNAYGNLKDRMFDQQPDDEMAMPGPTVGAERWKSLFKEEGNSLFLQAIQFREPPPAEASFARVVSTQMRPLALKEVGADLGAPMPPSDGR